MATHHRQPWCTFPVSGRHFWLWAATILVSLICLQVTLLLPLGDLHSSTHTLLSFSHGNSPPIHKQMKPVVQKENIGTKNKDVLPAVIHKSSTKGAVSEASASNVGAARPVSFSTTMQTFYGHVIPGTSHRIPFVVLPRRLEDFMLQYFRDMEFFQRDLRQLPPGEDSTGFVANVDHPEVKEHHYWEGCFHGRFDQGTALPNIFHPRHQRSFTMPAAPLEVRAFMEVIRLKATREWYDPVVRPRLLALAAEHPELQHGLHTLVEILDEGGMFASLAVQVHYGDAITQRHLHWHTDWANSLLHLGMTIGKGRRAVHRKCARTADAAQEEDMAVWFAPGESYVSSPKFFDHGVEFPRIDEWDGRVIALQSRMIFSPEQHHSLLSSNLNDKEAFVTAWTDLMVELDDVLVALPTVEEVKALIVNVK